MRRKLTNKQLTAFVVIKEIEQAQGAMPSLRQLGDRLGVTQETAHNYFTHLTNRGYLERVRWGTYRFAEAA